MRRWTWLGMLAAAAIVASPKSSPDLFTDVTSAVGITWKQFSGESADRFLIEAMGGGVAFLDFDNDGREDIFFVTGGETPKSRSASRPRNALYRNLGNGKFEDVAAKAGVATLPFYGMGAAAADFDNDGFSGFIRHRVSIERSVSQQRRWHVHGRDRSGRRPQSGEMGGQRGLDRLRSRRPSGSVRL